MAENEPSDQEPASNAISREFVERAPRQRVFKGVKIGFGDNYCAVDGVMRNVSETGAYLEIKDGMLIPDSISIFNEMDGYKRECVVVRRDGDSIGIKFVSEKQHIRPTKHQIVKMLNTERSVSADSFPCSGELKAEMKSNFLVKKKPVFGKRGR